jgi:hypothetical protein
VSNIVATSVATSVATCTAIMVFCRLVGLPIVNMLLRDVVDLLLK